MKVHIKGLNEPMSNYEIAAGTQNYILWNYNFINIRRSQVYLDDPVIPR